MRVLRSGIVAALLVGLLTTQASAQSAPAVDAPSVSSLRAIEGQVAQIRGLQPLASPDLRLLDHTSLHDYLLGAFDRDYLPNERESDQKELVILGLIQPTDDLVQIQLNLLTDQVVGVYDTSAKSLFVVSDQDVFGPAARITYAHEFNHALQDQHYDLNVVAPKHSSNNDRSMAVHGLIEGDAIMLQNLWAQQNLTQADLAQLARSAAGSDDSLARAPLIIRAELLFPYTDGFNFVQQAYRQGGNTYDAIDGIFRSPPESTAQVLHFDKYRDHVHPVEVELGDIATSLGPGWRHVGGGVLGELDTRVLLEQWGISPYEANHVSEGWSGDTWQLVEKNGRAAMAFRSTWESTAAAGDFFTAFTRSLRVRFPDASVEESSAARQALTTSVAATDVQLQGNDVLTVISFDRETASAIAGLLTPSAL
jgi:hypothetical protein